MGPKHRWTRVDSSQRGRAERKTIREDGVELNKCQQQVQKGSGAGVGCRMGREGG